MDKRERWHRAIEALRHYCESPDNPQSGPEFSKLVDEMYAALDDLQRDTSER